MSPAAILAAQLRALAVRATEQSSPVHLGQVLAESLGVVVRALEEADRVVGAAISDAFASLPLTAEDREALRAAGLPVGESLADRVAADLAEQAAAAGDQAVQFPLQPSAPGAHLVAALPADLSREQFDAEVDAARAILFGQVEG